MLNSVLLVVIYKIREIPFHFIVTTDHINMFDLDHHLIQNYMMLLFQSALSVFAWSRTDQATILLIPLGSTSFNSLSLLLLSFCFLCSHHLSFTNHDFISILRNNTHRLNKTKHQLGQVDMCPLQFNPLSWEPFLLYYVKGIVIIQTLDLMV